MIHEIFTQHVEPEKRDEYIEVFDVTLKRPRHTDPQRPSEMRPHGSKPRKATADTSYCTK